LAFTGLAIIIALFNPLAVLGKMQLPTPNTITGRSEASSASKKPDDSQSNQTGTTSQPNASSLQPLSFEQAVQLALKNNLTAQLGRERIQEARGRALQSLSGLLPNVWGTASQANETVNVASLGFQPGIIPGLKNTFFGPFKSFDARVRLVQNIFSLSAIRTFQSGRVDVRIADLQDRLATQQVIAATAVAYLETLRTDQAVVAADADLQQAQVLLKLAEDQHNAGVATGIDVIRAQTRVAEERVHVAQSQTAFQQAKLQLKRTTGLPLGQEYRLTDDLRFVTEPLPEVNGAIGEGERLRVDLQVAQQEVKLNDYERKAAIAEQYPSVGFSADYGSSGITPGDLALPTRTVSVNLYVPIFNQGLTRSRIAIASSRYRQAELQLTDTRAQVEQDIRLAIQTRTTAIEQVAAAQQSLQLAERQLQMARDRFAAGVADNIEVINAQTALSEARDSVVGALAQYNSSRINLAFALGRIETFRW
jgi:outer membrane protein TolC